jgi:hypothetical protein
MTSPGYPQEGQELERSSSSMLFTVGPSRTAVWLVVKLGMFLGQLLCYPPGQLTVRAVLEEQDPSHVTQDGHVPVGVLAGHPAKQASNVLVCVYDVGVTVAAQEQEVADVVQTTLATGPPVVHGGEVEVRLATVAVGLDTADLTTTASSDADGVAGSGDPTAGARHNRS